MKRTDEKPSLTGIVGCLILGAVFLLFPVTGEPKTDITNTKHNMSATGPGELRALPGSDPLNRVCIYCHTPHNATPRTPLWNKALQPVNYAPYTSTTMVASPSQPTGASRLCLSCHDGTLALGAVLRPAGGITMTGQITQGRPAYIGTALSDDHPVSFSYYASLPNSELAPSVPRDLVFGGTDGTIHCTTCHDPHNDTYGKFLVIDNRNSALCTKCHIKDGWIGASHQMSSKIWDGVLPDPWPKTPYMTVAENGCENCHTPHSAGGPQRLLYYLEEEKNCYPCHNGHVASTNIEAQFQKFSRHPVSSTTIGVTGSYHDPRTERTTTYITGHVECVDCHNPHAADGGTSTPPLAAGSLAKVSGVSNSGARVNPASYEYEVCFKCHADFNSRVPLILRVINQTNTRLEFNLLNPSYHPVEGMGRNPNVPSIPSVFEPTLTAGSIIYCSSCHSDDGESKGPHGSSFPPILRERYEMFDGTTESFENYALCYRCHSRENIRSDASFQKKTGGTTPSRGGHSGHLAARAPCSACHDPHGIADDPFSGSHTNLINFDTGIVSPNTSTVPPNTKPIFNDTGLYSGNCTLVCHGVNHSSLSYP